MWEQANELAEAHLEVDCDMVCAMHDLTCTMGCANVGVLSVVGWLGEHEEGTSKEKGRGKERAVADDEGEGVTGTMMAVMRMVVMMMPLPWSI